jgi:hypothetical protein
MENKKDAVDCLPEIASLANRSTLEGHTTLKA